MSPAWMPGGIIVLLAVVVFAALFFPKLLFASDFFAAHLWRRIEEERSRRKPKRIILVRHGESQGNTDSSLYSRVPDNAIELTERGMQQALEVGPKLLDVAGGGAESVAFFVSPFKRARQTYEQIAEAFLGVPSADRRVHFDPRLREQEWGNFQDPAQMLQSRQDREAVGRFYYRFPNGESGSDVFDRASGFLESLYREMTSMNSCDNVIIVTHGLFIRLFLMRYFHWSVASFEGLWNLRNTEYCVLEKDLCSARGQYYLTTPLRRDATHHADGKPRLHPIPDDVLSVSRLGKTLSRTQTSCGSCRHSPSSSAKAPHKPTIAVLKPPGEMGFRRRDMHGQRSSGHYDDDNDDKAPISPIPE